MSKTWVVAADSSRARIFESANHNGPLVEIDDLLHPEARLHESQMASDEPGSSFDSQGQGRHGMGSQVQPKQQEALRFAKQVCEALHAGRAARRFEKLYLVAAPAFLGMLRERLDSTTRALVAGEVDKNIAGRSPQDIRSHLPELL